VAAAGFVVRRPLGAGSENTLKSPLASCSRRFGVFWTGEGLGVPWPGEDLAIVGFAALFLRRGARGSRSRAPPCGGALP